MFTPFSFSISGFGFSDKSQPKYGFDYTIDGNWLLPKSHLLSK